MSILLLGGIAEARALAEALVARRITVVYSIAGLVRRPQLDCEVRVGGFSDDAHDGVEGMAWFVRRRNIGLIVDATHPYAARISHNAARAAERAGVACWRYDRPGWDEEIRASRLFGGWDDLMPMLRESRRPFFTLGRSALDGVHRRWPGQHWIVRTATTAAAVANTTIIQGIGPFDDDRERALMRVHGVDALITKNGGSRSGAAKLRAAADLGIPVYVQRRPALAPVERSFDRVDELLAALGERDHDPRPVTTQTGSGGRW